MTDRAEARRLLTWAAIFIAVGGASLAEGWSGAALLWFMAAGDVVRRTPTCNQPRKGTP